MDTEKKSTKDRLERLADNISFRSEKVLTTYLKLNRGDSRSSLKELAAKLVNRWEEQSKREEEFYKNACEILGGIMKKMEYMEETMCNVLLAIRQNEYLHPWYPSQAKATIESLNQSGIAYKT